jgi:uncharacterized membrane protein
MKVRTVATTDDPGIDDQDISMRMPASTANHPIHPLWASFPIGLWIFSLVCDLIGSESTRVIEDSI